MFDIETLLPQDAAHTLKVYEWIQKNLEQLRLKAVEPFQAVSVEDSLSDFHMRYTELTTTRFVPMTLHIFTDEDSLDLGYKSAPHATIRHPQKSDTYLVIDLPQFKNPNNGFTHILDFFDISSCEKVFACEIDPETAFCGEDIEWEE